MTPNIAYPVITFSSCFMDAFDNYRRLTEFSARVFMRWCRQGEVLHLVDSTGQGYAMSDPVPENSNRTPGLLAWILNSSLRVKFNYIETLGPMSLDDFKNRVIESLKRDSEIYDADGEIDRRIREVIAATDHAGVIEVFRSFM